MIESGLNDDEIVRGNTPTPPWLLTLWISSVSRAALLEKNLTGWGSATIGTAV